MRAEPCGVRHRSSACSTLLRLPKWSCSPIVFTRRIVSVSWDSIAPCLLSVCLSLSSYLSVLCSVPDDQELNDAVLANEIRILRCFFPWKSISSSQETHLFFSLPPSFSLTQMFFLFVKKVLYTQCGLFALFSLLSSLSLLFTPKQREWNEMKWLEWKEAKTKGLVFVDLKSYSRMRIYVDV